MPATFFIGDPHFDHQLTSDIRGFATPEDQNNAIINKWRKQVKEDDVVNVLGDVSAGGMGALVRALHILETLPGRKRWYLGNHDPLAGIHKQAIPLEIRLLVAHVFERVNDYGHISWEGRQILLSHYPYWASKDGPNRETARYEQFRLPDLGNVLIHAHTHHTHPTDGSATGREICVSWDAWRRLVDMGDITRILRNMESTSLAEYARKINETPHLSKHPRGSGWKESDVPQA